MASTGKGSRDKGARGENQLVHMLRDFYGYKEVRRGRCYYGEADIVGLDGVHIEVKRVEGMKAGSQLLADALAQSEEEAAKKDGGIPVVIHRQNGEKYWLVTMKVYNLMTMLGNASFDDLDYKITLRLEDFMDIYGGWRVSDKRMVQMS